MAGRRHRVVLATVLCVVMGLAGPVRLAPLLGAGSPAFAAGTFCGSLPDLTPNRWQGRGVGPGTTSQWENAANWSLGVVPDYADSAYVCIPSGGLPELLAGQEAQLVAMDIDTGARLLVGDGAKLFTAGDQSDQPSTVRGELAIESGTYGGPARTDVLGTLSVVNLGEGRAPAIVTRECAIFAGPYRSDEEPCVTGQQIQGARGLIAVADSAQMSVSGNVLNFADEFQLEVRGLLRIRAGGFVAASHGSRLSLRPHVSATPGKGTLRFEDDGGWLEGVADAGISKLGVLVNQGLIEKSGGTGTSLISATYTQPVPGAVSVQSGTLLLPAGATTSADVGGGETYGTGSCSQAQTNACAVTTYAGDLQNARLKVPGADVTGADVVVRELGGKSSNADIGQVIEAHADDLDATASKPAILRLAYDERLLAGKSWQQVKVFRRPDNASAYYEVPPCASNGAPPSGQESCVDRRGFVGSSRDILDAEGPGSAPDVVMVVRTIGTSRWIGR